MRTNLLETYGRQLKVAEAYVAKNFDGKEISANTQLTTAVLLDNTNRFMTEGLDIGAGARSDLGDWKKFCLNLTNIAVPSLIANDLVIVHPMTSYSGSVAYLKYVAGTEKGDIESGREFNGVFGLGKVDDARVNYTGELVIETIESAKIGLTCRVTGKFVNNDVAYDAKLIKVSDGTVSYKSAAELNAFVPAEAYKVYYFAKEFEMESMPASEKIASIKPVLTRIALVAEPRRIAVKYDQITAFQAKTDYGFSLDKQIAEQACGELAYEIDTEIVDMLREGCPTDEVLSWSKVIPVGVSKFEHYNGFLEVIEEAKSIIYKRTGKFHPNFMVIGAKVLQVLRFVNGFNAVKNAKMNGPYKVGEIDGINVYVSPRLGDYEFFFGLNGSDMMSAAGVYAPYMAIVPTQLLGMPDGSLQQGFSTWYAKALLNKNLLVKGEIAIA